MANKEIKEIVYKDSTFKLINGRTRRTLTISENAFKKFIDLCEDENKSMNAMIEKCILNYNKGSVKKDFQFKKCAIKFGEDGGIKGDGLIG